LSASVEAASDNLPNEPEAATALLNREKRTSGRLEWMSETFAPVQTLLNTRGALGTQAVSFLRGEPNVQLLTLRPCTERVTAPLGWVLSEQVRHDMKKQLDACKEPDGNCAGAKIWWVEKILNEQASAPFLPVFDKPTVCPVPIVQ
jgi:hypothetical protein